MFHNTSRYFAVCRSCDASYGDWKTWLTPGAQPAHQLYEHVWRKKDSEYGKTYDFKSSVDPDVVRHYHVHFGTVIDELVGGPVMEGKPSSSCALIIHFSNLFYNRAGIDAGYRWDIREMQQVFNESRLEEYYKMYFPNDFSFA